MAVNRACSQAAEKAFSWQGWERREPRELGLDPRKLEEAAAFAGGRGCVIRGGYLVHGWGDYAQAGDVASACKPRYSHFAFKAVELGLLPSLDALAADFEPRLRELNAQRGRKDARITFRHFMTQTSCYGVSESPGQAYGYNDFQMALFWDTLFLKVYGATYENVDAKVLRHLLTGPLGCEDHPTYMAFGQQDRPGRLKISPRDFARLGWLYLNQGHRAGQQLLSRQHAQLAVTSPLPPSLPRTQAREAPMLPGQRTLGSKIIPDDQDDHCGSYSYLWWVSGMGRDGQRYWPGAPADAYAGLGHANGQRGLAVLPGLDLVVSWNDTRLGQMPAEPRPVGLFLEKLQRACVTGAQDDNHRAGGRRHAARL